MAFHSVAFWACLGTMFSWVFFWGFASSHIKKRQPYSNRYVNRFADNVEVVAIIPLIPPILVYALFLRFVGDPLKRAVLGGINRRQERRHGLELRTEFGERRLMWAREDLDHVRREKMPLVEEVEVIASDGDVQTVKSALQTIKHEGFPFAKLPAELRIHIYSLLDYGTALRLSRVNRFFHYERPFTSIDQEQRTTFLFYAESFRHNKRRLACYECLRVLPRGDYLVEHRSSEFNKFGARELERQCFDCVAKTDANIGRWRLWKFRVRRWETRTFHRGKHRGGDV